MLRGDKGTVLLSPKCNEGPKEKTKEPSETTDKQYDYEKAVNVSWGLVI